MKRNAIITALALLATLGAGLPAAANEKDRDRQGAGTFYKYLPDANMRVKFNTDFTPTVLSYDVNSLVPQASLYCWGAHFVEPDSKRHHTKYRVDASALFFEDDYDLGSLRGRYAYFDWRTEYPELSLLGFDRDVYTWKKPAVFDRTVGGVPLAQLHATTEGVNAYYFANFYEKGKESTDDLVVGYCGVFNGFDYQDMRHALGRELLLQGIAHYAPGPGAERPRQ